MTFKFISLFEYGGARRDTHKQEKKKTIIIKKKVRGKKFKGKEWEGAKNAKVERGNKKSTRLSCFCKDLYSEAFYLKRIATKIFI